MKYQKGFVPVLLLLLVIIGVGASVGGYAVYKNKSETKQTGVDNTSPVRNLDSQVYTDKNTGFRLTIPASWHSTVSDSYISSSSPDFLKMANMSQVSVSNSLFTSFENPKNTCGGEVIKCSKFIGDDAGFLSVWVIYKPANQINDLIKKSHISSAKISKTSKGMEVYNFGRDNDFGFEKTLVIVKPNFYILFYHEIYSKDPQKQKEAREKYMPVIQKIIDSLDLTNFNYTLPAVIPEAKIESTGVRSDNPNKPGWKLFKDPVVQLEFSYPSLWETTSFKDFREVARSLYGYVPLVSFTVDSDQYVKGGDHTQMSVAYIADTDVQTFLQKFKDELESEPGFEQKY